MLKLAVVNSIKYSFNKKTWVSDMANCSADNLVLQFKLGIPPIGEALPCHHEGGHRQQSPEL